ncbi:dihydroorotate dehydrogenase electron transfer subunit [bacterium]|nr:dihydroorotate dehydrogenase electron transfer subunit [candidate division CSSED10-310 bacterium]
MQSTIVMQTLLGSGYYHLKLDAPAIAQAACPGQFLMVRIGRSLSDPLLRRPISIMDTGPDGSVELLYKVVGRGTRLLSSFSAGDRLDMTGPLGNGFFPPETSHHAVLIGGGIGIPPLMFLARVLHRRSDVTVTAFLGARTAADLPMVDRFGLIGATVILATETGETGLMGRVTDPLLGWLNGNDRTEPTVMYACGPDAMLHAVRDICVDHTIPGQLSLEEHMGCGIGACLGCVVPTRDGYRRVCTDGPVFNAEEITKWS